MGFLSLFKREKKPALRIVHPDFGELEYSRHDGWMSKSFELWGCSALELIVDGEESGPAEEVARSFREFRDSRSVLQPRLIDALNSMRSRMEQPPGQWTITGLTIAEAEKPEEPRLWTLWFDSKDDHHYMYGIQSDDNWATLHPFADD